MMRIKDFEITYKEMSIEQLIELATQMADLVPEAKIALTAELQKRGKQQSDIEQYSTGKREEPSDEDREIEDSEPGGDHDQDFVYMKKGPAPADWIQIPSFSIEESISLAQHMEQCQIPFKIIQSSGCGCRQCLLCVPKDRFKDCIDAVKESYGLTGEAPELFTGDCPACGTKLENSAACSDCGLVLCQDGWEARSGHPFVHFLNQNGLGKQQEQEKK
jgi:hypothetical protein